MITASLTNYRQSPRKVSGTANLMRGKSVDEVVGMLKFLPKKATGPLGALLQSAIANAKNNFNIAIHDLLGREIMKVNDVWGSNKMVINLSDLHLTPSVYILSVFDGNSLLGNVKFIKQ